MELHFYASMATIKGIQEGISMFVHTKEGRVSNENIHISLDTRYYNIEQFVGENPHLFKVSLKRLKPRS